MYPVLLPYDLINGIFGSGNEVKMKEKRRKKIKWKVKWFLSVFGMRKIKGKKVNYFSLEKTYLSHSNQYTDDHLKISKIIYFIYTEIHKNISIALNQT